MIQTRNLRKDYGDITAVKNITFDVSEGQVLGFLGPNGAGKSTTMKMIAGFLTPSDGSIRVCGHDVVAEPLACKSLIGYLPEGAPSYDEMTPRSFLNFVADVRGLKGARRKARIDDVVARLHLERVLEQSIETLSKGFKRRVGLAQAILHDPKVLILDEPTDGLDPNQKHEVRSLIRAIAADKIIIISTHILEEVDAVCNRVIIIANGAMLADDTPTGLEATSRYHNAVHIGTGDAATLEAIKQSLRAMPGVARLEKGTGDNAVVALPKDGANVFGEISALIARNDWEVDQLEMSRGRLDDVFRHITTGEHAAHG